VGKSLNAGWSIKSITPWGRKVSLMGQQYKRLTNEVECVLSVTALAMDNGDNGFTWVSCDLCVVSSILIEDVRSVVKKRANHIDAANVFLCAIHTHTAPHFKQEILPGMDNTYKAEKGVMSREEYHEFLVDRIADAVIEANKNKITGCSVQTGVYPVQTGCCRRGIIDSGEAVLYIDTSRKNFLRMEGSNGGPLNLMYIRDKDDKLRGVI
jgi:hypothetical protein